MTAATNTLKTKNLAPPVAVGLMKALVYWEPGKICLEDHLKPEMAASSDAIVESRVALRAKPPSLASA